VSFSSVTNQEQKSDSAHKKSYPDTGKNIELSVSSIPDDVNKVFKNVCMNCHATDGKKLAMARVNFSKWDSYSSAEQAKKAAAICKVLMKGSMPPKSFRKAHPDDIPTEAQIEKICKWSKTLPE
jgi:hypothetical protein